MRPFNLYFLSRTMTQTLLTSLKNLIAPHRTQRTGAKKDAALQQALTGYGQTELVQAAGFVPESDICDIILMKVLGHAHLHPELCSDGRIRVRSESGCTISIYIDTVDRSLQFAAIYRLVPATDAALRQVLVQRINASFRYARASLDSDGDLYLDYWYPYAAGLSEEQFLYVLRRFGIVCAHAVHTGNAGDIVL